MGAIKKYSGSANLGVNSLTLTTNLAALGRTYSDNIGAGAVANRRRVLAVTLHFSGPTSEVVVIKLASSKGSNYNTVFIDRGLTAETDYAWIPPQELVLGPGDNLIVTCTNSGGANIVYAEIVTEE